MKNRIAGFDGIRGIAAIAVIFTHTAAGFLQIGGFAVNLFFTLSGYLILSQINRGRSRIEVKNSSIKFEIIDFWKRRAARILPAYYAIIGICIVYSIFNNEMTGFDSIFYLTYLQNFYMAYFGEWLALGHTWTLAVEQQFYLLVAPLLLLIPSRYHVKFLICVIVLMAAIMIFGSITPFVESFTLGRMPFTGFLLGCAGGLIAIRKIENVSGMATAVTTGVTIVLSFVPASMFAHYPLYNLISFLLQITTCPLIVAYVAANPDHPAVRVLEHPVLVFLGVISYSLYLVHYTVADIMKEYWPAIKIGPHAVSIIVDRAFIFVITSAVSIAIAYLSWFYIENAFRIRRKDTSQSEAGAGLRAPS